MAHRHSTTTTTPMASTTYIMRNNLLPHRSQRPNKGTARKNSRQNKNRLDGNHGRFGDDQNQTRKMSTGLALALLSACRIDNLAGIIDCGIFMNLRFAVRRFGTFELFVDSVVVRRDARSFCRL